ncbi:MAG: hypothetical protein QW757_05235 [Candidatus Woesearchaeota archaeon]
MDKNVFIKIDEYNEILDIIALINAKVKEAKILLEKINELKNQEDLEIDNWKNSIDDIERKLKFVDQTLFEPRY